MTDIGLSALHSTPRSSRREFPICPLMLQKWAFRYFWPFLRCQRDQYRLKPAVGGGLMAMAGLWESWNSPAGERVCSFTIITTTPNELCVQIHNRMPAILKPVAWPAWLGEEPAELPQIKALLGPYPAEDMVCWPVSARVGNVRNNDPRPIEPISLIEPCAQLRLERGGTIANTSVAGSSPAADVAMSLLPQFRP